MKAIFTLVCLLNTFWIFAQGPYSPAADQSGTNAIHKTDPAILGWASSCTVNRGYQDVSDKSLGYAKTGDATSATGYADNAIVSLGDSGVAVLTFDNPISNTDGADFAVFENSFDHSFLELAFVEVSSDGINYVRFDAVSLTDTTVQTGSFGTTDPTNIYNLAGKFKGSYGTPFDLEELKNNPLLDVNSITHVKIIDVIGSIENAYATRDANGNIVNDPWPTPFDQSGFDLDAVAVIGNYNGIKEADLLSQTIVYPNPAKSILYVDNVEMNDFQVFDAYGRMVLTGNYMNNSIDISQLPSGIYWVKIDNGKPIQFAKE